ncbi:MAG: hypothetical protein A2Y17_03840 [Clostridiales bacterium GWF2_38_85]|nr:MAG: hypothetical protein A2Y17_03840 [Clostridiales bacterium GWF2_38_85]HBL83927.1 PAS domain-containing sensor histidine kinase [Clostridiales bacterium]
MKRRIFIGMSVLAFITVLITSVLIITVMLNRLFDSVKKEIKNEAEYISIAINESEMDYLNILEQYGEDNRISVIAPDGIVIYDNKADITLLENHKNRKEVIEALADGQGDAVRISDSLGEQSYYYAVKLNDGNVLRIANTSNSAIIVITSMIPYFMLVTLIGTILAMIFTRHYTNWIIVPINNFNLENPMSNEIYDELSPFIRRIEKQNTQIERHISTLKEKQIEMSLITGSMREGLIVLNTKLSVTFINESAARLFSIDAESVIGLNILNVYRCLALNTVSASALNGIHSENIVEIENRQYRFMASPLQYDTVIRGVVILIVDETDIRLAEQQRREFSANVSHELKTPLTSISGYTELLRNRMVKTEDIPEFADRIYKESTRLISLIEDIIKLSKLDEGIVGVPHEPVDLHELAIDIANRLKSQAEARGVSVEVNGDSAIIVGSKQIFDEILYNLCDNAIKYNINNGKVEIKTEKTQKGMVLTISDTGIGISKEDRERVFERFYRVDKSHSKNISGTGLGLSIVKHGVKYHNGSIELESEKGKGTKVIITFPE